MKKVLLDINAYTALRRGDETILDVLGRAETVYMSAIVLGELHAGFKGGSKEARNRKELDEFTARPTVRILHVTQETAEIFGTIKHRLKTAGTPIPINDVWIAAQATEAGAHLVTYDEHFTAVPGLLLWQ
jgi:tRNA(fMet)-specific endonuclease VapC